MKISLHHRGECCEYSIKVEVFIFVAFSPILSQLQKQTCITWRYQCGSDIINYK